MKKLLLLTYLVCIESLVANEDFSKLAEKHLISMFPDFKAVYIVSSYLQEVPDKGINAAKFYANSKHTFIKEGDNYYYKLTGNGDNVDIYTLTRFNGKYSYYDHQAKSLVTGSDRQVFDHWIGSLMHQFPLLQDLYFESISGNKKINDDLGKAVYPFKKENLKVEVSPNFLKVPLIDKDVPPEVVVNYFRSVDGDYKISEEASSKIIIKEFKFLANEEKFGERKFIIPMSIVREFKDLDFGDISVDLK